jgi:hypothetical protein
MPHCKVEVPRLKEEGISLLAIIFLVMLCGTTLIFMGRTNNIAVYYLKAYHYFSFNFIGRFVESNVRILRLAFMGRKSGYRTFVRCYP